MINNFNNFLNEGLLKGKSKDDIIDALNKQGGVVFSNTFKDFLSYELDFNLLPRDEQGYIIIDGNLTINLPMYVKNGLPDKMIIYNNLVLDHSGIGKLPNGLIVKGDLDADNCDLYELPSDLFVGHNLYIFDNFIKNIPSTIKVKGEIFIQGNPMDINKQPKNLKIYK